MKSVDPGHQFARRDSLGDVVICAKLKPDDAVCDIIASRNHNNTDIGNVVAPERSGRSGCQGGTDELPWGPVSQGSMWVDLVVVGEPGGQ